MKKAFFLLLLVSLLMFSGCQKRVTETVGEVSEKVTEVTGIDLNIGGGEEEVEQEPVEDLAKKFRELQEQAAGAQAKSIDCSSFESLGKCHGTKAAAENNPAFCEKQSSDSQLILECKSVYAGIKNDPAICNEFQEKNERDYCLLTLVSFTRNASYCNEFNDPQTVVECEARVEAATTSYLLGKELEALCLGLNESLFPGCDALFDDRENAGEFCLSLENPSDSNICISIAGRHFSFPDFCLMASDDQNMVECVKRVAATKNDRFLCVKIHDKDQRNECYSLTASVNFSASSCKMISATQAPEKRNACLAMVAKKLLDPETCLDIKIQSERGVCAGQVAGKARDYSLCSKIPNLPLTEYDPFLARDLCFMHAAKELRDANACEPVNYAPRKDACLSSASNGSDFTVPQPAKAAAKSGTCAGLGGQICGGSQYCRTPTILANDTSECCIPRCYSPDECRENIECDDGNPATADYCSGDPRKCVHSFVSTCVSGDDYCPGNCYYANDTDCPEDRCQTDSDCNDSNPGTIDECITSSRPHTCEYTENKSVVK